MGTVLDSGVTMWDLNSKAGGPFSQKRSKINWVSVLVVTETCFGAIRIGQCATKTIWQGVAITESRYLHTAHPSPWPQRSPEKVLHLTNALCKPGEKAGTDE